MSAPNNIILSKIRNGTPRSLFALVEKKKKETYTYIYISQRIKEDASILCDSEFRAWALVTQKFIQWRTYLLRYKLEK